MKRIRLALFVLFVITGALLSVSTVYLPIAIEGGMVRQSALGGLILRADELAEKPQTYFPLDNPDSYVLQAISNPGEVVFVGNWITLKSTRKLMTKAEFLPEI